MTHPSSPASSIRSTRKNRPALTPLKPLTAAILSALCSIYPLRVYALDAGALPTNGQITAGSGSISQSGNVMNVVQGSDRMVATWNTFNIGSAARVNFAQPSAASVALNRVTSSDASRIMGQLNANGQVYLVNPSGILFGQGSAVNVGGLVASSLNISDASFMAGNNRFEAGGTGGAGGAVINQGSIVAADGGYVALLGAQVRNEGSITARLGSVMLGAGEKVTLDFNGDGLINMQVSDPALGASVVNQGLLKANGGMVVMSARSGDALLSHVVNNEGVIEATSLQRRNGTVLLDGGGAGVVAVSGRVDVSGRGAGETGGSFKALGQYVGVFDGARIDASGDAGGGAVLVGGNYQGSGSERQAVGTYMGEDARIHADAISSGDGGKVILWSTDSTRFHGGITVLGGGQAGRGGLVETSGHYLDATGSVDLSAASGKGGTWLLDPFNINITSTASVGATGSSPFTSSGAASSNLSSAVLNASLSEGANVIVQTTNNFGGTSGDINVLDNVRGVGNASLTLQAHRNIIMGSRTISNGTGKTLNVSLFSNFNNSGNGSVALTGSTITTNGGSLTISGGLDPATGYASTNLSGASGVAITGGTTLSTGGGNITIRGAVAPTSISSTSSAVNISGSTLNAGGGNISILANVGSASATGDAFVLTGGSNVLTSGAGSITVDSTNLGSGNGTRVFSTNNTLAASGSGSLTIRGNASSGFGVLICSTAATSTQKLTVGSGALTVQANSNGFAGSGRGAYLAASGNGAVVLNATAGGAITLGGSSTGSYGTVLNATGSGASISIFSDGAITVAGNTSGGTTPALGLLSSGSGASAATASQININSTAGALKLLGNNSVVNPTTGSFKAVSLDASGSNAGINLGTQSGALTLDGTSHSGRGVDIAPSGANAAITISSNSGAIAVNGNSTSSFGGYGIFLNSTGNSNGVSVSTVSGDITLRGDSIGTSDAIALGGSAASTNSVNNIASQGGNIMLVGNFHSPNVGELDHGIAIQNVANRIQTTGAGNVTLVGSAADQGNGVSIYGGGKALLSVENGALAVSGSSVYGDGVGVLTGNNVLRATGSGSVSVTGSSTHGSGVSIFPSTATSSAAISTVSGKLAITGNGGAASAAPAVQLRSAASGAANGVSITSGSGDIDIQATTAGSGEGLAIVGSSANAFNTVSTGGSGNLRISASGGSHGVRIDGGTNKLQVENGLLLISASAPNGQAFSQSSDATTIAATGSGAVLRNLGGTMNNSLTSAASAAATAALQSEMAGGDWMAPLADAALPPSANGTDKLTISVLSSNSPSTGEE